MRVFGIFMLVDRAGYFSLLPLFWMKARPCFICSYCRSNEANTISSCNQVWERARDGDRVMLLVLVVLRTIISQKSHNPAGIVEDRDNW